MITRGESDDATERPDPKTKNLNVHRRALSRLHKAGVARRSDVNVKANGGRRGVREYIYSLSDVRKGEVIVAGARANGIKGSKRAKADYGRVGLPGNHTRVRNDFLISFIVKAREANRRAGRTVVAVPLEKMWSESAPFFPRRGAKITRDDGGRKLEGYDLQRAGYSEIEVDGNFAVEWMGELPISCYYDVELELDVDTEYVARKVNARSACYFRLLMRHREAVDERRKRKQGANYAGMRYEEFVGLPDGMVPVLFLLPTDRSARNMRDRLQKKIIEGNDALVRFAELQERPELRSVEKATIEGIKYQEGGALVGRYYLFGGLDRIAQYGPFAPVYYPLTRYPMSLEPPGQDGRVSLELVARERAQTHAGKAEVK